MQYEPLTASAVAADHTLADWRFLLRHLHGTFRLPTFRAAAELVGRIAAAADAADHHPNVDLRYPGVVHVDITTHATGGLTHTDAALAREISTLAAEAGAEALATAAQALELALDTTDADAIRPFWAAVLGYREDADGALFDPAGWGPAMWFQEMDPPRRERGRFHLDVTVAHDVADARVAAALAAGGRLVSAEFARSWWVLADADGNEACVCTWQDRG